MMPKPLRFSDADVALKRAHWARRLPEMLASADSNPYWQFRAAGDIYDRPECTALDGRIERWDSPFWQTHHPAHCQHRECRCTIRIYLQRDIDRLGLRVGPNQP